MVKEKYLNENKKPLTPFLAMEEASRCLLCHDAPCSKACPAGTDPAKFIRSIRFRNFKGAVETIRTNNPLGAVCARVCPYENLCQGACSRCGIDKPINIGGLQRFATDFEQSVGMKVYENIEKTLEKIAIIGSGPSGLTAAKELAECGYKVTVFEEKPLLGGWLTYGIPANRLPQEVVLQEISYIKDMGVEFVTECKVTEEKVQELRCEGYKAFLVCCGIQKGKDVVVPGSTMDGVVNGVEFLGEAKTSNGEIAVPKKVIVIGGGDVAMDCAATAKLLGCEDVKIVYRRTIEKMPASIEEKTHINELAIPIFTGLKPSEIVGENGKVVALKAEGMFDNSSLTLETDMVIFAVGQEPDEVSNIANVEVSTMNTEKCDVFAAGDIVEKDKTVVQAVASGKEAAKIICEYLKAKREEVECCCQSASTKEV